MIGILPTTLKVGGREYPIHSDFRTAMYIFTEVLDSELSDLEKAQAAVQILFGREFSAVEFKEAVKQAYWFLDGGDMPKSKEHKEKVIDWRHDESIMFPALNKVAGQEIRSSAYMHFWTFLGLFGELEDGLFSTVLSIRTKKASHKPLDKWEKEIVSKNKELFRVYQSREDEQAVAETQEFLKELIGE